jgi:phosphatidylethanolamine/phosphatidyl-N-methylethanolamine N-methyltransferase
MTVRAASGYGDFLRGLVHDPRGVSAPTPSSPRLAKTIAEQVDISRPGIVLELGPGTGVVTQALLDRGLSQHRLVAIEQEPSFARLMAGSFPMIALHQGDALHFEKFLPPGAQIAAIVSGLPLLNFPPKIRLSLLMRALACQDKGIFIQLSYSWRPPVPAGKDVSISRQIVWRNFPPAHVWKYAAQPDQSNR